MALYRLGDCQRILYTIVYLLQEGTMTKTAKLFWSGRSQAVRLPKEFQIDGDEVRIRKQGTALILEPVASDRGVQVMRYLLDMNAFASPLG